MYLDALILEFTISEILAPSRRSAVLRSERGHAAAPACGFMQRMAKLLEAWNA